MISRRQMLLGGALAPFIKQCAPESTLEMLAEPTALKLMNLGELGLPGPEVLKFPGPTNVDHQMNIISSNTHTTETFIGMGLALFGIEHSFGLNINYTRMMLQEQQHERMFATLIGTFPECELLTREELTNDARVFQMTREQRDTQWHHMIDNIVLKDKLPTWNFLLARLREAMPDLWQAVREKPFGLNLDPWSLIETERQKLIEKMAVTA
jgi:hypothetical protein